MNVKACRGGGRREVTLIQFRKMLKCCKFHYPYYGFKVPENLGRAYKGSFSPSKQAQGQTKSSERMKELLRRWGGGGILSQMSNRMDPAWNFQWKTGIPPWCFQVRKAMGASSNIAIHKIIRTLQTVASRHNQRISKERNSPQSPFLPKIFGSSSLAHEHFNPWP